MGVVHRGDTSPQLLFAHRNCRHRGRFASPDRLASFVTWDLVLCPIRQGISQVSSGSQESGFNHWPVVVLPAARVLVPGLILRADTGYDKTPVCLRLRQVGVSARAGQTIAGRRQPQHCVVYGVAGSGVIGQARRSRSTWQLLTLFEHPICKRVHQKCEARFIAVERVGQRTVASCSRDA